MKRKVIIPVFITVISMLPVLSRAQVADVWGDLISILGGNSSPSANTSKAVSPLDFVSPSGSPLDFVSDGNSALDFVAGGSPLDYVGGSDAAGFESLAALVMAGNMQVNPAALDVISSAYGGSGFYKSGVFDNYGNRRYVATSTVLPPMSGLAYYDASWGRVTSGFGYREKFKRMHKGIDIAMAVGDTVRVALPGVVETVTYEARGYGHYIVVRHDDGVETRYAHLSRPLVVVGERVEGYQPIALSGNTGNSTGPHLHFETRYNGAAVDPAAMFDFSGDATAMAYTTLRNNAASYGMSNMGAPVKGKRIPASKSTYIVRDGDTPKSIANRAGIPVLRLCQLNFITEDQKLETGTMLRLR